MAAITFPTASSSSLSTLRKPFLHSPSLTMPPHLSPPITLPSPQLKTLKKSTFKTLKSSSTPITAPFNLSTPSSFSPSLKYRLGNGETLYGLFLLSFSPTLAEIAGLSGYDFVVVDMEHGHGGTSAALPCLHALAAARTPAILRIPESNATWAKKALDLGPQGIMFPMIEGPKMARKAVSYCRFPPNGVRGSAHTVVRASGYGIDEGYLSNYEDELLIMCQSPPELGPPKKSGSGPLVLGGVVIAMALWSLQGPLRVAVVWSPCGHVQGGLLCPVALGGAVIAMALWSIRGPPRVFGLGVLVVMPKGGLLSPVVPLHPFLA